MSEYGILAPTFWTRGTGKALRGFLEGQNVALYLTSAPTANMIGLYYMPLSTVAHDTGIPLQGARKALARLIEDGFCEYDTDAETVFVRTMAQWRLHVDESHPMKAAQPKQDHRHPKVVKLAKDCGSTRLLRSFWNTYHDMLALPDPWWDDSVSESGSGSGSDPDQIQIQNIARAQEPLLCPSEGASRSRKKAVPVDLPSDWIPSESLRSYAQKHGRDSGRVAETMRAWAESHSEKRPSWDGTFRTFVLKAEERNESPWTGASAAAIRTRQTEISLTPTADALPPSEQAEQARRLRDQLSNFGTGMQA